MKRLLISGFVAGLFFFIPPRAYAFGELSRITLPSPFQGWETAVVVDTPSQVSYLGSLSGVITAVSLDPVVMISSADLSSLAAPVSAITALAYNPLDHFLYAWIGGYLVKLKADPFQGNYLTVVSKAFIGGSCYSPVLDMAAGIGYFPVGQQLNKIRLSDLTVLDSFVHLEVSEIGPGYIDGPNLKFIGENSSAPINLIITIRLSDGKQIDGNGFDRSLPFTKAWFDPAGDAMYLTLNTNIYNLGPALMKVRLSDLSLQATLTLKELNGPFSAGFIHTSPGYGGYGYFLNGSTLYKIRLADLAVAGKFRFSNIEDTQYPAAFWTPAFNKAFTDSAFIALAQKKAPLQEAIIRLDLKDDAGMGVPPPPAGGLKGGTGSKSGSVYVYTDGYVPSAGYNLYYSTAPGVTTSTGTKMSGVNLSTEVMGLKNGTTYYFIMTTFNANGESIPTNEVAVPTMTIPLITKPSVTDVSPRNLTAGDPDFILHVYGVNFISGFVIRWNGTDKVTQFVSSGELTTSIPASDIQAPGQAAVDVLDPGSLHTNSATVLIAGVPVISRFVTGNGPLPTDATVEVVADNVTSFSWSVTPKIATSPQSGKASLATPVSQKAITGTARLNLSTLGLSPGVYTISVSGVNSAGKPSLPSSIDLTLVASNLDSVAVHPSPWRSDLHAGYPITFDNLPTNSTIKIFTLPGRWVRTLSHLTSQGTWDLKNDDGDLVASGLFLYLITDDQGRKIHGKFAIAR